MRETREKDNKKVQLFSDYDQVFNCDKTNVDKLTSNDSLSMDNKEDKVSFVDNIGNIFDMGYNSKVIEVEFTKVNKKKKRKDRNCFVGFLMNKKILLIVMILTLFFTMFNVGKDVYFDNIDGYEDFFTVIDNKESLGTVIYNDNVIKNTNDDEEVKVGAAEELVNCIKDPLKLGELPNSIDLIVDELNEYYNQSNNYFAFKYKDIYTGFSVSHNEEQGMFAASTIKAPKDIYIYEMASLGKIDLDEELAYTSGYYNTGSGLLKHNNFNTDYKVRKLLMYSTVYSDNAAHNMLMDRYGRENMLNFWKEKGANVIFTQNNNWVDTSAHDASIYMEELYNFYIENEEYGQELMDNFFNAIPKFIKSKDGSKVANKSGWSGSAIHDVAIVFTDNPYIVVGLSNLGDTEEYNSYFNKVSDFAYRIHNEYWKYKMELCGSIEQYEK